MLVLKDFKTVNSKFKAGQTPRAEEIENLDFWMARGFVDLEPVAAAVVVPTAIATEQVVAVEPAAPAAAPAAESTRRFR